MNWDKEREKPAILLFIGIMVFIILVMLVAIHNRPLEAKSHYYKNKTSDLKKLEAINIFIEKRKHGITESK